jgi:hypothetical protein
MGDPDLNGYDTVRYDSPPVAAFIWCKVRTASCSAVEPQQKYQVSTANNNWYRSVPFIIGRYLGATDQGSGSNEATPYGSVTRFARPRDGAHRRVPDCLGPHTAPIVRPFAKRASSARIRLVIGG